MLTKRHCTERSISPVSHVRVAKRAYIQVPFSKESQGRGNVKTVNVTSAIVGIIKLVQMLLLRCDIVLYLALP